MKGILDIIIQIIAAIGSTFLILLFRYGIAYLKTRTQSAKIQLALSELEKVISDGVSFTEQTLVNSFKSSKTWTREAKKQCLDSCVSYVLNNLTDEAMLLLTKEDTDIREWVISKVEAHINNIKK